MSNDRNNEIAVVGAICIDAKALDVARRILEPEDFAGRLTGAAFAVACELQDSGAVIDAVIIADGMEKRTGENCVKWVADAMGVTSTAANVEAYARLVKENANRRKLLVLADSASGRLIGGDAWEDVAERLTVDLEEMRDTPSQLASPAEMVKKWRVHLARVRAEPGCAFCATGYAQLDRQLGGGLFKQGLYIIGARPGMGKTTLGVNLAESITRENRPVLFVSLEMSETQIMARRTAAEAGIGYTELLNGSFSDTAGGAALKAASSMSERPFYIYSRDRVRVDGIAAVARQIKGLQAIFVDYLGLIEPETEGKSLYEQTTKISVELKRLAKRLDLPVVALCQLNRESTSSVDKRPKLQHLRNSGAIEQDADGVILLHREGYYENTAAEHETIELIIAKNRHGSTGTVKTLWNGRTGTIYKEDLHEITTA